MIGSGVIHQEWAMSVDVPVSAERRMRCVIIVDQSLLQC
jgi:hypothetical protein